MRAIVQQWRGRGLCRSAVALLTMVLLAGIGGCRAEQRGLGREDLLREIQALATPNGVHLEREALIANWWREGESGLPPAGPGNIELARAAFAKGDLARAAALREGWTPDEKASAEGLLHQCAVARTVEDTQATLTHCSAALSVQQSGLHALGALSALWSTRTESTEVFDRIANEHSQWKTACEPGAGCAAFLLALNDVRALVRSRTTTNMSPPVFALTSALVEGPFSGEAATTLWEWPEVTPRRERFASREVTTPNGLFFPARRNEPGVYRLKFSVVGRGEGSLFVEGAADARVFVDGQEVVTPDSFRSDIRVVDLSLESERHSIEVVVAASGYARRLRLRTVDRRGGRWLSTVPEAKSARSAKQGRLRMHTDVELLALTRDASRPYAALDHLLLTTDIIEQGRMADPKQTTLNELLGAFSAAPASKFAIARLLDLGSTRRESTAKTRISQLLGAVRKAWPHHPSAWLETLADVDVMHPMQAWTRAQQAYAAAPQSRRIAAALVTHAFAVDAKHVAMTVAREGLKGHPPVEMLDAAIMVFERAGRFREAAQARDRLLKFSDDATFDARVRLLLRRGDMVEAMRLLDERAGVSIGDASEELRLDLLATRSPAEAMDATAALFRRFPNDRRLALRTVELLVAAERRDEAAAVVQNLNRKFGADRDLHAWAEDLSGTVALEADLAAGERCFRQFIASGEDPFAADVAGYLLDRTRVQFFRDGGRVTTRHELVELKTKEAIDAWGDVNLTYDEKLALLVVRKRDGTRLLPERHDALGMASLTGLQVGDVVEMIRIRYDEASVIATFDEVGAIFAAPLPAKSRVFEVLIPSARKGEGQPPIRLDFVSGNGAPPPTRETVDDDLTGERFERYRFVASDVGVHTGEPYSAPDETDLPFVIATRELSVRKIAAARYREFSPLPLERVFASDRLRQAALQIAGAGTPDERFAALFSFVAREIDPGAETDVERILLSGQGRRTWLLMRLAMAVELDVTLIGVHLPTVQDVALPTGTRFALTAVAHAMEGDKPTVAVVENGTAVLNALPTSTKAQWITLGLGTKAAPAPLSLEAMQAPPFSVDVSLEFNGSEAEPTLSGLVTMQVPPHRAHGLRNAFRNADAANRRAAFEATLGQSFPGVVVTDVQLPNLADDGAAMGIAISVDIPIAKGSETEWPQVFADGVGPSLGIETGLAAYLSVADRDRTLVVAPRRERLRLQIALGTEATFTDVPNAFRVDAGPVSAEQSVEVKDGTLRLERSINVRPKWVSPAEFPERRAEWLALMQKLKLGLHFIHQTTPPTAQRHHRMLRLKRRVFALERTKEGAGDLAQQEMMGQR